MKSYVATFVHYSFVIATFLLQRLVERKDIMNTTNYT